MNHQPTNKYSPKITTIQTHQQVFTQNHHHANPPPTTHQKPKSTHYRHPILQLTDIKGKTVILHQWNNHNFND